MKWMRGRRRDRGRSARRGCAHGSAARPARRAAAGRESSAAAGPPRRRSAPRHARRRSGRAARRSCGASPRPAAAGSARATMRAGMPTAVAPAGTSQSTTALAPITACAPIVTPPSTLAPAPMSTWPASIGAPGTGPPVPRVTCWNSRQFGPMRTLGWMTMPFGCGSSRPPSIAHFNGMSAPVTTLQKRCRRTASQRCATWSARSLPWAFCQARMLASRARDGFQSPTRIASRDQSGTSADTPAARTSGSLSSGDEDVMTQSFAKAVRRTAGGAGRRAPPHRRR